MRLTHTLLVTVGISGCSDLTSNLGQSDDDVLSVTIPSQQPTPDLGIVTQVAAFSRSSAELRIDIEAGKADVGNGAETSPCLTIAQASSQVFVVNVSPTNGAALMRISLLKAPATDAGPSCKGEMRKAIEVIVQRPASNPPADGGVL